MSKRLGRIKGCKYKTSSWHLNAFPDGNNIGVNSIMSGRSPPLLYCTLTLSAMQGHQKNDPYYYVGLKHSENFIFFALRRGRMALIFDT